MPTSRYMHHLVRNAAHALIVTSALVAAPTLAGHHGESEKAVPAAQKNIVDTAVAAGSFKTLAAALEAAGLIDALAGEGPFTVFAPTDAAFAKLPEGTVEMLLKPENKDKLIAVLTYHVVPGAVDAAAVVKLDMAKTINGEAVEISADSGAVMINNATVVKADIGASNGIIHVVDTVILPPAG